MKDGSEGFFEQVAATEGCVVSLNDAELVPLFVVKVSWVLKEDISGLLVHSGLFGRIGLRKATESLSAHRVDRFGIEFEDVKKIKDDLCIRRLILDGLDEYGGYIDVDDLDFLCPLLSELSEEIVESLRALPLVGPDDAVFCVVDDGDDVVVPFPKSEIVDADARETVEPFRVELIGDDSLDYVSHRALGDAHHFADLGLICGLGQVGANFFEGHGEATACSGPGKKLSVAASGMTCRPPWNVFENRPDSIDGEVDPAHRSSPVVIAGPDLASTRAVGNFPQWPHPNNRKIPFERDFFSEKTSHYYVLFDKFVDAQVLLSFSRLLDNTKKQDKSCAFQYFEVFSEGCHTDVEQADSTSAGRLLTANAGKPFLYSKQYQ